MSASPWACRPDRTVWRVVQLRLEGLDDDGDGDRLRAAVYRQLGRTSPLAVPMADAPKAGDKDVALHVRLMGRGLQVILTPQRAAAPSFEALVPLPLEAEIERAVSDGVGVALEAILAMKRADDGGPQGLRAALVPERGAEFATPVRFNVQSFAVRRLAQLHDCAAAEDLRALVVRGSALDATATDEALALQAVGSLVALGDQEAVLPMIALTRHRDGGFVVQMAHAIGALGGPMAEAYLVTLASGHLDEEVRHAAAAALEELGRRSVGGAPPCSGAAER